MADYQFPDDCWYTKEDEWVREEDEHFLVGVTDYAQQQLGDVVFLELPEVGSEIQVGEPFGVIESVKAVSELYAPLSGTVVEANTALEETPELVNESCYESGWILKIALTAPEEMDGLLTVQQYKASVAERDE